MTAGRDEQPAQGRRVLLISKTDITEPRDGGSLRVAALVRELRRVGFVVDVHVVRQAGATRRTAGRWTLREARAVLRVALAFLGTRSLSTVAWFRPGLVRELLADLAQHEYDLSVVEFTQLLSYLPLVPQPVVVDMHNVESELMRNYAGSAESWAKRLAARYEAGALEHAERALPGRVAAIATVSARDGEVLREMAGPVTGGAELVVASNGVDDAAFETSGPRTDTVVFVAHLGWRPNVDAALWLVREVWPLVRAERPDLVLELVGRSPAPAVRALAGPGVEVHADVPSVLPHVAAARVATAPLLAAGGTRLKILEALACGTPLVATPLGALGLEALEGPGLHIAERPADFAAAVLRLAAADPDREVVRASVEPYRWRTALAALVDQAVRLSGAPARHGG